jgi:hypothetical protein
MDDAALTPTAPRNLWMRALLMLLMAVAFQIAAWALWLVTLVQLVFAIFTDQPNARLQEFGRGLGRYLGQIARFESFATEDAPFPFSDWPAQT